VSNEKLFDAVKMQRLIKFVNPLPIIIFQFTSLVIEQFLCNKCYLSYPNKYRYL